MLVKMICPGLSITNSRIDMIKPTGASITGEVILKNRYIDGVLKDGSDGTPAQPLWPWPMEQRIQDEMGISVTNLIAGIIPSQVASIADQNRPFLAVSPPILPFGNVSIDQSVTKQVNLKNIGTGTLTIDDYRFDSNNLNFSITSVDPARSRHLPLFLPKIATSR